MENNEIIKKISELPVEEQKTAYLQEYPETYLLKKDIEKSIKNLELTSEMLLDAAKFSQKIENSLNK